MRYIIKGGVWKNSEDEILKAAVMKYGLNQWSRISSLLVRKSAKQCKARWYEWLDPSIKKTEWTREEEEKLLHLAKIFPCQWRTIAPIVGRTPAQCVEHYDKLLDQAQGKEEDENDPRKLKPGEIDPTPETKPARPDPIDMDEDEKEMLAEARVRLANTKGKKAKRKAREKQIEEARRLASLQKKRELKAAGIDFVIKKKNNNKKIDYNIEVPLERKVTNFVFNPGPEEDPKPDIRVGNIALQTLEGKRREEEEENLRKIDQKKIKKLKDKDLPIAIEKINKANTTFNSIKTKLMLPSPQMGDKDLELLGKLNSMNIISKDMNPATRALIGDYSQREATPSNLRTPRYNDAIIKEAQNVLALQNVETPLVGGHNLPLNNPDFSGLTPKTKVPSTPNILAQTLNNLNNNIINSAQTPLTSRRPTDNNRGVSIHDELKLNSEDFIDKNWEITSQSQGKISEEKIARIKSLHQKQVLKETLSSLPKPKNEFQITIPEIEEEDDNENNERELDAEEINRLKRKEREMAYEQKMKMRSLAVQKNLPRPFAVNEIVYEDIIENENVSILRKDIEKMINEEFVHILAFDNLKYPFPNSKPINFNPQPTTISKDEAMMSEKMILEEIDNVKSILKHGNVDKEFIDRTWEEKLKNIYFDNEKKKYIDISQLDKSNRAEILQRDYQVKKELLLQENKMIQNLEQKLGIILGGYGKKLNQIQRSIEDVFFEFDQKSIEKDVFQHLSQQEIINKQIRLEEIQKFYSYEMEKERELQRKYASLLDQKEDEIRELNGFFS